MNPESSAGGLYDPAAARASCGVGAAVNLDGKATHALIETACTMLRNLDHRGARGAEEGTGDGAGILLQKPHAFFDARVEGLPAADGYGVGQVFFPRQAAAQAELRRLIAAAARERSLEVIAWRRVPTGAADLGRTARASEPVVFQFFVAPQEPLPPPSLDAQLYLLRRLIERRAEAAGFARERCYVCSLDRRRIVYKGLLTCGQLQPYFPDLSQPDFASALALVHSRFSTNTLGAWHLAHPYRCLVHNGEVNTLRGNQNWQRAREADLASPRFGDDIALLQPVTAPDVSDSSALDNVLELLIESGRPLPHALRMMIPEAWSKDQRMAPERRAFYDYHATLMEPWDGPALVVASDGERVAAVLDRNGLRPCRLWITRDDRLILGSETGLIDLPPEQIVHRGRLRPGQLLLADTRERRIVPEDEVFTALTASPYADWLAAYRVRLDDCPAPSDPVSQAPDTRAGLTGLQRAFGYTEESLRRVIEPMAANAKDAIGAMGNDAPPAALSGLHRPLFDYFTQLFAQVSNPPIDYLREDLVTSLEAHIGRQRNLLEATPAHCRQLLLRSPILDASELDKILQLDTNGIRARQIPITCNPATSFADAIAALRVAARAAIADGVEILVLSDRDLGAQRLALPSLLALGAVHHDLIRHGLRTRAGLVLDSGHPCSVHHVCTLLGYGADAVHPWLASRSVGELVERGLVAGPVEDAAGRYRAALEDGVLKVMSKMGVSTLQSYRGAQVFEALGLAPELIDDCFTGTWCPVPGATLADLERETRALHAAAFAPALPGNAALHPGGQLYWRRDGELHQWTPQAIGWLQQAVRTGDEAAYRRFAAAVDAQEGRLQTLRGLLEFALDPAASIPLEEVEPEAAIMQRFATGSMSFGALSQEAHEALAVAMNRIGAISGTGEGGEQVERFGSERACSMKQVASGRFGVTIDYLVQARQIEIKMAQGSKPGEGGELPGGKVDAGIAAVRFTTPGVGLISPPPHHDIYSIEDLAQLIHDLKCANPQAEVHVKLVAIANVGTIAAGVAKARADAVLISGDSGGTGASLKTSIKHAGSAWEIGLAETHQALLANDLRSRIRVRADGGLKTGRDAAVAALLGAEEFGFGTAPLVALGCVMLRKCHCNTCSVGVATQDPALRRRFAGDPAHVVEYLRFVARELREIMAALGFRRLDDMVGRVDRLRQRHLTHPKGIQVDLSRLLHQQPSDDTPRKVREQRHGLEHSLDQRLIRDAQAALETGWPVRLRTTVRNRDRAVGTLLSSAVARRGGLPPETIVVECSGSAGQSFGAFLARGVALELTGDANDYIGKGLSGGRISVRTPPEAGFEAAANIVVGNVALYGATSGEAYFNGQGGERFAVRNSGAAAVVEGVGDHGCEYMTGGAVVVLGATGKNFGAGMSGGEAYLLDDGGALPDRLNPAMVALEPLSEARDRALVQRLLENHLAYTGSAQARAVLADWPAAAAGFVKVMPKAFAEVLGRELAEGRDPRMAPPAAA